MSCMYDCHWVLFSLLHDTKIKSSTQVFCDLRLNENDSLHPAGKLSEDRGKKGRDFPSPPHPHPHPHPSKICLQVGLAFTAIWNSFSRLPTRTQPRKNQHFLYLRILIQLKLKSSIDHLCMLWFNLSLVPIAFFFVLNSLSYTYHTPKQRKKGTITFISLIRITMERRHYILQVCTLFLYSENIRYICYLEKYNILIPFCLWHSS